MKLVVVKWIDSSSRNGWISTHNWKAEEPLKCTTVGFVVGATEDSMEIAQTFSAENDTNYMQVHHVVNIPKVAITSITDVPTAKLGVDN